MKRIMITGHTYLAPEWSPLEILVEHDQVLLSHAMYLGEVETTQGIAHSYKHDTSRRTIYILGGIPAKYKSLTHDDAELVPFTCTSDALTWWLS
jgi:hypothetical protein